MCGLVPLGGGPAVAAPRPVYADGDWVWIQNTEGTESAELLNGIFDPDVAGNPTGFSGKSYFTVTPGIDFPASARAIRVEFLRTGSVAIPTGTSFGERVKPLVEDGSTAVPAHGGWVPDVVSVSSSGTPDTHTLYCNSVFDFPLPWYGTVNPYELYKFGLQHQFFCDSASTGTPLTTHAKIIAWRMTP
jgi:hypothetical protein